MNQTPMEDKRTALAIFLIIAFVMVYTEMVMSPYKQPAPASTQQVVDSQQANSDDKQKTTAAGTTQANTSLTNSATTTQGKPAQIGEASSKTGHPSEAEIQASPIVQVETENFIANITQLGGRLLSFKLKNYKSRVGENALMDLVSSDTLNPIGTLLPLAVYSGGRNDDNVNYALVSNTPDIQRSGNSFSTATGQELRLKFQGILNDGSSITKELTFRNESYVIGVDVRLETAASDGSDTWLGWSHHMTESEISDSVNPEMFTILDDRKKIKHIPFAEVSDGISDPITATWGSFGDKYFTAAIIPAKEVSNQNVRIGKEGKVTTLRVRGSASQSSFNFFAGPKNYDVLQAANFDLYRSIDLGFFSFLAYPLLVLMKLFYSFLGNYGLSIVLLTLAIKAVFYPLTKASMKSMKAMQKLQPEMKALRERIKDPNQLNQEVLGLYKKHGVNPMGGCLPVAIQIPVFFGLFSALQNAIELRHAHFALWINDLSAPERLELFGINIPVMILIMGASMFLQQYITPSPTADPSQRKTMLIVSGVFTLSFLIYPFPAGLALYMLVNTTISIIQQFCLTKEEHPHPFRDMALASLGIFLIAFLVTMIPYNA